MSFELNTNKIIGDDIFVSSRLRSFSDQPLLNSSEEEIIVIKGDYSNKAANKISLQISDDFESEVL